MCLNLFSDVKLSSKWWGWGDASKSYDLETRPKFFKFLKEKLEITGEIIQQPVSLDSVKVSGTRVEEAFARRLVSIFGENNVRLDDRERFLHSFGKGYLDLICAWNGAPSSVPDVVVYPTSESQIEQLFGESAHWSFVVVPYGGATSVVGGVESRTRDAKPVVCLDFRLMNRVLEVDARSLLAKVQPGCLGPELERELNGAGVTLGHFPQSFEYSSVGGWVATRSAGYESTRYGKIEEMVESLRLVTPEGVIETPLVPASATGPNLLQILVGSEGTIGVITSVTLKLRKAPQSRSYVGVLFKTFTDGIEAVREMMQKEIVPNVVRLSDPNETRASLALASHNGGSLVERVGTWYLAGRGYFGSQGVVMILAFEGSPEWVDFERRRAWVTCRSFGGFSAGSGPGGTWHRERFDLPYLRDKLMGMGVLADTLETATTWSRLPGLYSKIMEAFTAAFQELHVPGYAMAHISHEYQTGASLYFTFMAKQLTGREEEEWHLIKNRVTDVIVKAGASLSHHHGVGVEHVKWMEQYYGPLGIRVLKAIKHELDPATIMNPDKLLPAS
jgi:alkyldihydroxyacetonephosphate synthase